MKLRRFSADDVARIRDLAELGVPANAIAKAIGHTPDSVRHKAVALGIKFRPMVRPKFGSRFKIPDKLWRDIAVAATARGVKPTKLCHMVLSACARDDLWTAVIDAPLCKRPPVLKPRQPPPPSLSLLLAPQLVASLDREVQIEIAVGG